MIETSVQGNHTEQDPGVFKEVAGSSGMQNQWGMHPKCCNLRIGMQSKTETCIPEMLVLEIPESAN